ncbi:MAG: hypothetical protein V3W37_06635 [Candidatus Binatia bacterium]
MKLIKGASSLVARLLYTTAAVFLLGVVGLIWFSAMLARELMSGFDLVFSLYWLAIILLSGWTLLRVLPTVRGRSVVAISFPALEAGEDKVRKLQDEYPTARVRNLTLRKQSFWTMVAAAGMFMLGIVVIMNPDLVGVGLTITFLGVIVYLFALWLHFRPKTG